MSVICRYHEVNRSEFWNRCPRPLVNDATFLCQKLHLGHCPQWNNAFKWTRYLRHVLEFIWSRRRFIPCPMCPPENMWRAKTGIYSYRRIVFIPNVSLGFTASPRRAWDTGEFGILSRTFCCRYTVAQLFRNLLSSIPEVATLSVYLCTLSWQTHTRPPTSACSVSLTFAISLSSKLTVCPLRTVGWLGMENA